MVGIRPGPTLKLKFTRLSPDRDRDRVRVRVRMRVRVTLGLRG